MNFHDLLKYWYINIKIENVLQVSSTSTIKIVGKIDGFLPTLLLKKSTGTLELTVLIVCILE